MFEFLNKIKSWFGFADINQDGKIDKEDFKIVADTVKTETKKVVAAKKEAVGEVKAAAKTSVKKAVAAKKEAVGEVKAAAKTQAKKVVAAKKEAVGEVKATVKRGRPKKTD